MRVLKTKNIYTEKEVNELFGFRNRQTLYGLRRGLTQKRRNKQGKLVVYKTPPLLKQGEDYELVTDVIYFPSAISKIKVKLNKPTKGTIVNETEKDK